MIEFDLFQIDHYILDLVLLLLILVLLIITRVRIGRVGWEGKLFFIIKTEEESTFKNVFVFLTFYFYSIFNYHYKYFLSITLLTAAGTY